MKHYIISKLKSLINRYETVEKLLNNSEIIENQTLFQKLVREYTHLFEIRKKFIQWKKIQKHIDSTTLLLDDAEMHEIANEELEKIQHQNAILEQKIKLLLLPTDPKDKYNCYIEIRAGTGGSEAANFAGDLFRMYNRYAENRQWHIEIINAHEGEHGGYKTIIAKIIGAHAYGRLKFESGGHRVQRVPNTESQGRIHTSACTIAVIPEMPEKELMKIKNSDLKIDTFRASGAGGQHVNTTDSAIRITHLPTGIVVECQDERSQHKNKSKALSVLRSRIHAAEIAKRHQEKTSIRRNLLGSGDRYDRCRTYNFPQGRVTDHRINLTLYCLDKFIEGDLDLIIEPILNQFQENQLATIYDTN
ncbi:MAG: peptide chain release factor 1 [Candidatus Dasytiphilus stammeri]